MNNQNWLSGDARPNNNGAKKDTTMNLFQAHNQWSTRPSDERFQTLAALTAAVDARRLVTHAFDQPVCEVAVKTIDLPNDGGQTLIINGTRAPMEPTNWAFGQLCGLAKAPAAYLRTLPPSIAAPALQHSVRSNRDQVKFMVLHDPDGGINRLAATTSPKYGRIWDADVARSVGRIVDASNGRFHNPPAYKKTPEGAWSKETEPSGLYASDHDIFLFMIDGGSRIEAGDRAQLHRGFIVWNSEVGAASLGIMTFLFNAVCGNHIIWGASDVNTLLVRHNSGAPARLDREVTPLLLDYAKASAKPMEVVIQRARNTTLLTVETEPSNLLNEGWVTRFSKRFDFTRGEVRDAIDYATREEGQCVSLWDMVQGLTASAREYEYVDARVGLEKRAGKLLDLVRN